MADEEPVRGPLLVDPDDQLPFVQPFPKMLYHAEMGHRVVATADAEAALQALGGWSDVPPESTPKT